MGVQIQLKSFEPSGQRYTGYTQSLQVKEWKRQIELSDRPSYPNFQFSIQEAIVILLALILCPCSRYFSVISGLLISITVPFSKKSISSGMVNFPIPATQSAQRTKMVVNLVGVTIQFQIISTYSSDKDLYRQSQMKPAQEKENTEKSEDYQALINQEYNLVVDGKNAQKLVKLFRDFETDPFAIRIEKVDGAIEKYAHALLINGQYLDLTFLILRYKNLGGGNNKRNEILLKIGDSGKKEDLKQLWEQTRIYIGQLSSKAELGQRINEATIDNTINILSRYFLNLGVDELTKLTGITEKELVDRGVEIRGKFIQLKQEEAPQTDCLQSKLKEIAVVASKMSQFE